MTHEISRALTVGAAAVGVACGAVVGDLPRACLLAAALAVFWICLATVLGTAALQSSNYLRPRGEQ